MCVTYLTLGIEFFIAYIALVIFKVVMNSWFVGQYIISPCKCFVTRVTFEWFQFTFLFESFFTKFTLMKFHISMISFLWLIKLHFLLKDFSHMLHSKILDYRWSEFLWYVESFLNIIHICILFVNMSFQMFHEFFWLGMKICWSNLAFEVLLSFFYRIYLYLNVDYFEVWCKNWKIRIWF